MSKITVPEAISKYQVSRSTIGRWIDRGWLAATTLPNGRSLIEETEVAAVFSLRTGDDTFIQEVYQEEHDDLIELLSSLEDHPDDIDEFDLSRAKDVINRIEAKKKGAN